MPVEVGPQKRNEIKSARIFEIPNVGKFEVIPLNKKGLRCVDPRDKAEEIKDDGKNHPRKIIGEHLPNEIKFFGGVIGLMMALAAAAPNLSAEQVVSLVVKFEKKNKRIPTFHDDTNNGCGCGFVSKARNKENEKLFGIKSKKVTNIKETFAEKIKNGLRVKKIILKGSHKENAVLILVSDQDKEIKETAKPVDANDRFFIYDKTASHNVLRDWAEFVREKGIKEVTEEDIIKAADQQVDAALILLASGLPIYEVDLTGVAKPVVTPKGEVPRVGQIPPRGTIFPLTQ